MQGREEPLMTWLLSPDVADGTGGRGLQLLQQVQDSGSLGLNPEPSKEETGMLG